MYDIIITLILITVTLFGFIGQINLQPDFAVQQLPNNTVANNTVANNTVANNTVANTPKNKTLQFFNQTVNAKNNSAYSKLTNLTLIVNDTFKLTTKNKYSMNKTFENIKPIVCWIGNRSLHQN